MATKAKIRKKKKDAPAPSVSNVVDNKDLENTGTDKSEKDPVLVKTAPVSNILDTVSQESIKDEEEEIKIVNDVNKNDDPQKKKDGVYEKRDQEKELRSRSPSQLSVVSASRRSPSPFKTNVVEPAPDDGTNLGSSVSLRSNISAKEAWSDTGSISKNDTKKSKSKVSTTPVTTIDSNKNKKPDDTVSLVSRATLNAEQSQNAYIPYVHARNCIKQMTRDMENMKISHVRIVHDIEKNYRAIEDEAQNQFNMFILSLKQQYNGKVKTFKQVVEVHRVDLESKETYWQNVFKSLTDRNNKILREKKAFLIKHKLEIERLIKEKETIKTELTSMVDKANSESKQVEKDYAEKIEKESTSHKNLILQLEEEKKILQDELERERKEKDRLNTMILEGQGGTAVPFIDVITADTSKPEGESEMVMPVLTVAAGREEKEQMEDEREQMSKERLDLLEERQHIDEERKKFSEERKVFVNEMSRVQEEINQSRKDSAEWEAKYNSLKADFSNSLTLQVKYKALENQYLALSAIVTSDTASATKAALENEEKSKSEKDMMENEKKRLQNEIAEWEKEFQKRNNRSPEEEDKSDSAKELYTTLEEVNTMVESLDKKIETFHKVQSGNVPDVPEVSAVPFVVKDPEIRTVEVTVPDPTILATLAKCQEEVEQLKSQLSESQREKSDLNSTLSEVNSELLSSKTKITELETKLALEKEDITTQESVSAVPVISSASTEEIEELKRKLAEKEKELEKLKLENSEMLKDMKKMVKRYNKLDEKLKASSAAAKDSQLLQVVASLVRDIHSEVPAASDRVNQRVADVTADKNIKEEDKELQLQALQIIQNGVFVEEDKKETQSDNKELENKITELEERIIDLESENDVLRKEREENLEKIEEAESELTNFKNQPQISTVAKASEDDELQKQLLELQAEKSSHDKTKTELDNVQTQLQEIQEDLTNKKVELETELETIKKKLNAEIKSKEEELTKLNARNDELEKDRLSNVPLDSANEIKALQKRISVLEKEKKELDSVKVGSDSKVDELQSKLDQALKNLNTHKASNKELETKIKAVRSEKEKAVKDLTSQLEKKDQEKLVLERKKTFVGKGAAEKGGTDAAAKALKEQLQAAKRENIELNNRIKQLEKELSKSSKSDADAIAMDKLTKRHEKILKELEKKYEMEKSKNERNVENIKEKDEEIKSLTKDCNNKNIEIKKLEAELETLGEAAKEGVEAAVKVKALEADNKNLIGENKILSENFNSERILRKKYYNMVEDMKGKIRVYCRARPLSSSEKERGNVSVINSPDEYSLHITTTRGLKEFQYDQVFMEGSSQEQVFADTNNLIQSAVDGYNVCMFAYGQTGSGKTFTMIGDREQKFPGIAPRAFQRIFELAEENKSKFNMKVSTYMLELYNDKLIDLFAAGSSYDEDRLDIKKDKKGMVVVQGSVVKEATNSKELFALFEEGSKNRHVASTKMNAESSRSHLIVGIVMESTNKVTGQILKGKLSLVDLAGSERVGKTGATAEQLKEAMSINKSLSALGDVISALSSEQSFIPYRNNKLTMLMQDSLGGNAKTLMFVNISPADYNQDESVISLTYASRVKLITNDASKNADNKEIARLKNIIQKLKQGEAVDEED